MSKNNLNDLHAIVNRASEWPEQARAELEEFMLNVEARYYGLYIATKDDRAALKRSADDVKHNRFASDDNVKKVFRHFNRA